MKNILKKIGFASVVVLSGAVAAVAAPAAAGGSNNGVCALIGQMYEVFRILRTLAFVGAAFIIAGWAWGYISKPGDFNLEDLKKKGTGMLVGFVLLVGIGIVLTFLVSSAGLKSIGCDSIIFNWGRM